MRVIEAPATIILDRQGRNAARAFGRKPSLATLLSTLSKRLLPHLPKLSTTLISACIASWALAKAVIAAIKGAWRLVLAPLIRLLVHAVHCALVIRAQRLKRVIGEATVIQRTPRRPKDGSTTCP